MALTFLSPLSLLKKYFLSLTLLSIFLFFLLTTPKPAFPSIIPKRSLAVAAVSAAADDNHCKPHDNGVIDYSSLHFCIFNQNSFLSIPSLSIFILLHFYILIKTAQTHFSVVTTKLASLLNLSPSMGAVTLLALGNGAPDVFASVAAVRGGQYRTGFSAILSAGTFVSALVVGFVAIYAAPFSVDPASFVRDVSFYLIAAFFLFYVYLSGEIFIWQAVAFVGFYVFFVGIVFWMDLGIGAGERKKIGDGEVKDCEIEIGDLESNLKRDNQEEQGFSRICSMVSKTWEFPITLVLKLTIPQTSPSKWNRFYMSANIALSPLLLLYSCNSFVPFDYPIYFILPNTRFHLWFVVLFATSSLAVVHYVTETEPPKTEQISIVISAFVMSVFWISTIAGELLNCLAALGSVLKLSPSILGLTVLAWGNSVGDLVADVAVAKAGHPAMAMAGCFAGPMFNMLVGLGTALVIETADVYPNAYELKFYIGIVIAFVFLLFSLMGSFLVITWFRFRVPKFWGFCLVGVYIVFTIVSIVIATFTN